MLKKLEAVIFDFDGTVIDTEKVYYLTMKKLTKEWLGEDLDKMDYIKNVSGTNAETSKRYYEERYNMKNYDDFEEAITKEILDNYHTAEVLPNIEKIFKFLKEKGVKVAIASNGMLVHIEHGLKEKGLYEYVDAIATKEEVDNPKPAPDVYLKAAEKVGADISRTIAVEDSKPGALGAAASGAYLIVQTNEITNYMDFSGVGYKEKDVNLYDRIVALYNEGL